MANGINPFDAFPFDKRTLETLLANGKLANAAKKYFRKVASALHPDQGGADFREFGIGADAVFKNLNGAYQLIESASPALLALWVGMYRDDAHDVIRGLEARMSQLEQTANMNWEQLQDALLAWNETETGLQKAEQELDQLTIEYHNATAGIKAREQELASFKATTTAGEKIRKSLQAELEALKAVVQVGEENPASVLKGIAYALAYQLAVECPPTLHQDVFVRGAVSYFSGDFAEARNSLEIFYAEEMKGHLDAAGLYLLAAVVEAKNRTADGTISHGAGEFIKYLRYQAKTADPAIESKVTVGLPVPPLFLPSFLEGLVAYMQGDYETAHHTTRIFEGAERSGVHAPVGQYLLGAVIKARAKNEGEASYGRYLQFEAREKGGIAVARLAPLFS